MNLLITFTLFVIAYFLKKYEVRANKFDLYEIKYGHKYRIGLSEKYNAEYYSCTPFSITYKIIYQSVSDEIIFNHLSDIYDTDKIKFIINDNKFIKIYK